LVLGRLVSVISSDANLKIASAVLVDGRFVLDRRMRNRILDAMREMGVLFMVLAPLDATVSDPARRRLLLLFAVGGVLFFVGALLLERTRGDGSQRR
jgi:hypothetical protein